ncbi:class I fumarate hydratase [Escherichia coli]|uniref:Class I fumarate hydratase n=1 Tax=Escherichia coli TaxID=562 RepID=A0A376P7R6_ECOLX|nr:class I fumarate hydratase [Escherichia coli]
MKLASAKYYDELPTEGNEHGQAFRDVELEKELLIEAQNLGLGAQFGGKYFAHDIRVIRLPRHGASCPVGMGVSCSADRNIKAKINRQGIGSKNWNIIQVNISLKSCVKREKAKRCALTLTVR